MTAVLQHAPIRCYPKVLRATPFGVRRNLFFFYGEGNCKTVSPERSLSARCGCDVGDVCRNRLSDVSFINERCSALRALMWRSDRWLRAFNGRIARLAIVRTVIRFGVATEHRSPINFTGLT